ncbi:MAG: hypothetical protein AB7I27_16085 [Bacteriovoracaceae bacterium]
MSNTKFTLAYLSLLSVLTASPNYLVIHTATRSIAAAEASVSFPKYDYHLEKIDSVVLVDTQQDLKLEQVEDKAKELKLKIEQSSKEESLNLVWEINSFDDDIKILKKENLIDTKKEAALEELSFELKKLLEPKLPEIDKSKKEEKIVEKKKESASSESECPLVEQNKLLTEQVHQLMIDQNNIMQALLNLTQALTELAQRAANPFFANSIIPPSQQYSYSTNGGSWQFVPNGQVNLGFSQPNNSLPQLQFPSMQPQLNTQNQGSITSSMPSWNIPTLELPKNFEFGNFGAQGQMSGGLPIL